MSMSNVALAIPLALGIACSTSGAQSREHVASEQNPSGAGASAASQAADQGGSYAGLEIQPTAGSSGGSDQTGTTGSSDSSGSSGSMGSQGSSGSSETMGSGEKGSHMGSGGSSETMGSGEKDTPQQGAAGSSDQGQGATAGAGDTGAHAGDQHVMGKITKISKDEISIAPKGAKAKTLKLNDDTSVMVNGKDAKWSQLKKGQSVRASYDNVSGDDVAVRIESGAMRHGRMKKHGASGGSGSSDTGSSSGGGGSSDTGASGPSSGGGRSY